MDSEAAQPHQEKREKKEKRHKKHDHEHREKDKEKHKERILSDASADAEHAAPAHDVSFDASEPVQPPAPTTAPRKLREFRSKNLLVAADEKRAVEITFSKVNYSVDVKKGSNPCGGEKETRHILKNINGGFRPGTLTAIMGASGAGKTSMLNLIANRVKKTGEFRYSGEVLVNGQEMDPIAFQRTCAYLMQDDVMFAHLTVREQIYYCAKLQLKNLSEAEVKERVEGLIVDLGLTACADTLIGKAGVVRGVSGGERKRTAIACELVTDPRVIFCDEPTSGLDSETAIAIMGLLSDIAHAGRTVVCTIHQPSSEIFAMFDNLLLLSKGRIVFQGPSAQAVPYFASIGHPCPIYANPADFLMKILHRAAKNTDLSSADAESDEARFTTDYLANKYEEKKDSLTLVNSNKTVYPITLSKEDRRRALPLHEQCWVLLQRAFTNYRRDRRAAIGRLGLAVVIGLLMGLIFLRLRHDQVSIQSRAGFLFTSLMFAGFVTMNGVLLLFPEERPVFMREYAKGMYSTISYFLAKNLAEFPFQQASFLLSAIIYYYMVGLNPGAGQFFIYLLFIELMIAVTCSVGLVIGAGARNEKQALAFGPMLLIPLALFGGLFLNSASTPKYFIWLAAVSPFKYGFHGTMINEMRGTHYYCKSSQFTQNGTLCPFTTGEAVLDKYDIRLTVWANAGIMFGLIFFFRTLAYLSLLFFAKRHKSTA